MSLVAWDFWVKAVHVETQSLSPKETTYILYTYGEARDFRCVRLHFNCSFDYKNRIYPDHLRGTPGYLAPELHSSASICRRAVCNPCMDVYALGCILFRLIFGGDFPTEADVTSRSLVESPFVSRFNEKCNTNWKGILSEKQQQELASILWHSIRQERDPRLNGRYRKPADLAAALGSFLDNLD